MSDSIQMISGAYGNRPITSGAGVKTFTKPAYGCRFTENTVITAFKDDAGKTVDIGWAGVSITPDDGLILFGTQIKSITVTQGGKGCYYLCDSDL